MYLIRGPLFVRWPSERLHVPLLLQGISGSAKDGAGTMQKMAALIPPPPPAAHPDHSDNATDDDWD